MTTLRAVIAQSANCRNAVSMCSDLSIARPLLIRHSCLLAQFLDFLGRIRGVLMAIFSALCLTRSYQLATQFVAKSPGLESWPTTPFTRSFSA
jgi:hypothetical protein